MNEIKIESGIEIPLKTTKSKGPLRVAMEKMKVGESFVINKKLRERIGAIGKGVGIKLTSRKIGPDEVRVWRVE